jgi:hypothetical protein
MSCCLFQEIKLPGNPNGFAKGAAFIQRCD